MRKDTHRTLRLRLWLLGLGFTAALAGICARAVMLQAFDGPRLSRKAADQVEDEVKTAGKRGTIYDRRGQEMAVSVTVSSIAARPAEIPDREAAVRELAAALRMKPQEVRERLDSPRKFVWIKRQAGPRETEALRRKHLPGIEFVSETNRFYPNRSLAAHVLGFTGVDGRGLEGVEFYYDAFLRPSEVSVKVLKDARRAGFLTELPAGRDPDGKNVILTLDHGIQYLAESALNEAVAAARARSGMAIVMEPATGAILALAIAPSFNPNAYEEAPRPLWRNRAVTDPFEPGSIMKIFLAAAALEHTPISPRSTFHCENGRYQIGRHTVHDVHHYGVLSFQDIIRYSSNIGAAKIGGTVGPERLHETLSRFGFGRKTGIDSPAETSGLLPPYRKWAEIDTAAISFGHGMSASALQLASAVSAIANGGVLMKPHLVSAVTDAEGREVERFAPVAVGRAIRPETARTLREILQSVLLPGGTGVLAALDGYTACGKTGTARKVDERGQYVNDRHLASFIGFAPAEDPRITVLVVIDEPKGQVYGGAVAAPVFKKIAQATLTRLNVPPAPAGGGKLRVAVDGGGRG